MSSGDAGLWANLQSGLPSPVYALSHGSIGWILGSLYLSAAGVLRLSIWILIPLTGIGYPLYRALRWHLTLSDGDASGVSQHSDVTRSRIVWLIVFGGLSVLFMVANFDAITDLYASESVSNPWPIVLTTVSLAFLFRTYRNIHYELFSINPNAYWPVFTDILGRLPIVYAFIGLTASTSATGLRGFGSTPLTASFSGQPAWHWAGVLTPLVMVLVVMALLGGLPSAIAATASVRITPLETLWDTARQGWEKFGEPLPTGESGTSRQGSAEQTTPEHPHENAPDGGDSMSPSGTSPPELDVEWLPLSNSEDNVKVEKTYQSTGELPTVKLSIESHRADEIFIRLREPVPVDFSVESIRVASDQAEYSETWSKHAMGSYLEYRARLNDYASVTTGFALDTESTEQIKQFLSHPPQIVSVEPVSESNSAAEELQTTEQASEHSEELAREQDPDHPSIESPPPIDFSDVAGLDDVKKELQEEVIEPFEDPAFERYDIGKVNGVLFYGPPGTGKTYLAEALAGELGYNYMPLDTADIVSTTVGESVERLDDYFEAAREYQPCVMFFDEIDAITADRSSSNMTQHQRQTVNTMLETIADINEHDEDLLVVAATNKPDEIDEAMKRTGRFDTAINIGMPDSDTRLAVLNHHLESRGPPVADFLMDSEFLEEFATESEGLAASDITEVAEAAQRAAIRDTGASPRVQADHVFQALDDVREKRERDVVGEFVAETPDLDFDDVGGMEDLKSEFEETVIQALEHPDRYEEYGLEPPTGILLYGPPGTGKTYLSRALAGEAGVTFLSVSGADVLSKWVGEAAENIQELIDRAKAVQPCILFIDELDAIAGERSASMTHSESGMVNELLTGLSDLDDEDVVVIATTNRPDQLDDAVTRSGRMDNRVEVPPPDGETRVEILKVQLQDRPVDAESIDWEKIKQLTAPAEHQTPLVASDLEQIADEAARTAMEEATEEELQPIEHRHLVSAINELEPSLATAEDWQQI